MHRQKGNFIDSIIFPVLTDADISFVLLLFFQSRVTYEIASDLTYVGMCMNESMRLFPPAFMSVFSYSFMLPQAYLGTFYHGIHVCVL